MSIFKRKKRTFDQPDPLLAATWTALPTPKKFNPNSLELKTYIRTISGFQLTTIEDIELVWSGSAMVNADRVELTVQVSGVGESACLIMPPSNVVLYQIPLTPTVALMVGDTVSFAGGALAINTSGLQQNFARLSANPALVASSSLAAAVRPSFEEEEDLEPSIPEKQRRKETLKMYEDLLKD